MARFRTLYVALALMLGAQAEAAAQCVIDSILANITENCNTNGTGPDFTDDYFMPRDTIFFHNKPSTGTLTLDGPLMYVPRTVAVNMTTAPNFLVFEYSKKHAVVPVPPSFPQTPIELTATFSDAPCTFTETDAGVWYDANNDTLYHANAPFICSVNVGPASTVGGTRPSCFASEFPDGSCEDASLYAPDTLRPEDTPIRYVKVVFHIFQREDTSLNNFGKHIVDPDGAGNFTTGHLPLIQAWFDEEQVNSVNWFLANLCDDPTDGSERVKDSHIRFLNEGIDGQDVFFHPNNRAWGMGYSCENTLDYPDTAEMKYLTSPDINHVGPVYHAALTSPDVRNSFHVFVAGASWRREGTNLAPDHDDCVYYCSGGYTSDSGAGCQTPFVNPVQVIYGTYYDFLSKGIPPDTLNPDDPEHVCWEGYPATGDIAFGRSVTGEFYHVMSLDHLSPFQAHWMHDVGADGCEDTPIYAPLNILDFNPDGGFARCAMTKCQVGKLHHHFTNFNPRFERFPNAQGGFTAAGNCDITDPLIVINDGEYVTWERPKSLRSSVLVRSGGRLTIECRVGMPAGATITVETGGKLIIRGEVHNNCSGTLWGGVVVNGSPGLPQTLPPTGQGYFVLTHGGTIEGASTSYRAQSGAMVFVADAFVRNSGGAIYDPYPNSNIGYINRTSFTCNGATYDFEANGPFFHLGLLGVRNLKVSDCGFYVAAVPTSQVDSTSGIIAIGSSFRALKSRFDGFDTGIAASDFFPTPFSTFTVNDCTFTNNTTGIFALNQKNFAVTNNRFELAPPGGVSGTYTGLMMDNCTGYRVEENHFKGLGHGSVTHYGTLTEDSGNAANFISGNAFVTTRFANQAQGDNRGENTGLQYWCNIDTSNTRDFLVTGGLLEGIRINQGNNRATMNTFSHIGAGDSDFKNEVGTINYFYKDVPAHDPQNPTGVTELPISIENTCPQDEVCCDELTDIPPTLWTQTENEFNAAKTNWYAERVSLVGLMDGGNTGSLLTTINGATVQNAAQLTQQLLGISPYLSNQVLMATIGRMQVLTEASVTQVLNANPDGLREAEVQVAVKTAFSASAAAAILANAGNQTARTTKEGLVGEYRTTMMKKADLLIHDILLDTVQLDLPLLRTWLANKESLEADYAIVGTYLSAGDFQVASQKLAAIPSAHTLDATETAEHGHFGSLVSLWQDVYTNHVPMDNLGPQRLATVQYLADNSERQAGAIAKGILNTWYGGWYRVVPDQASGGQGLMAPPTVNVTATIDDYLIISPNPAQNNISFQWTLPDDMDAATITLADLQGKIFELLMVTGQQGKQNYDTSRLEHGIYTCQIRLPDGRIQTTKLIIQK